MAKSDSLRRTLTEIHQIICLSFRVVDIKPKYFEAVWMHHGWTYLNIEILSFVFRKSSFHRLNFLLYMLCLPKNYEYPNYEKDIVPLKD